MNATQAIIFFGIVISSYVLINFYIVRRVLSVVPAKQKKWTTITLISVMSSFFVGRLLQTFWISYLSDTLVWIGSFWIAITFYTFLCLTIIDFIRLINHFFPFFPAYLKSRSEKVKKLVAVIVSVFVLIMVVAGFINSRTINIRNYNVYVSKKAGILKHLNIVMVSDMHLGTINGKMFAYNIVDKITKLKPDIVLLAGDIIDEDINPVLHDKVGDALYELKAKYGVYGINGNHEYIGGVDEADNFLKNHGFNILRDSVALINNSFYLVGRDDLSKNRFESKNRKALNKLLQNVDKAKPIIMMDHQPFNLKEAFDNGIDLQLSGHTHNGQLWPINYIVERIYELAWGLKRKGHTCYYVSCGVAGWGPPVRTGSRPEIVKIKLHFVEP
jgi:uncharacterized protein